MTTLLLTPTGTHSNFTKGVGTAKNCSTAPGERASCIVRNRATANATTMAPKPGIVSRKPWRRGDPRPGSAGRSELLRADPPHAQTSTSTHDPIVTTASPRTGFQLGSFAIWAIAHNPSMATPAPTTSRARPTQLFHVWAVATEEPTRGAPRRKSRNRPTAKSGAVGNSARMTLASDGKCRPLSESEISSDRACAVAAAVASRAASLACWTASCSKRVRSAGVADLAASALRRFAAPRAWPSSAFAFFHSACCVRISMAEFEERDRKIWFSSISRELPQTVARTSRPTPMARLVRLTKGAGWLRRIQSHRSSRNKQNPTEKTDPPITPPAQSGGESPPPRLQTTNSSVMTTTKVSGMAASTSRATIQRLRDGGVCGGRGMGGTPPAATGPLHSVVCALIRWQRGHQSSFLGLPAAPKRMPPRAQTESAWPHLQTRCQPIDSRFAASAQRAGRTAWKNRCTPLRGDSAGVIAGSQPVAAVTASRMAACHSATTRLVSQTASKAPSLGVKQRHRVRPPSSKVTRMKSSRWGFAKRAY